MSPPKGSLIHRILLSSYNHAMNLYFAVGGMCCFLWVKMHTDIPAEFITTFKGPTLPFIESKVTKTQWIFFATIQSAVPNPYFKRIDVPPLFRCEKIDTLNQIWLQQVDSPKTISCFRCRRTIVYSVIFEAVICPVSLVVTLNTFQLCWSFKCNVWDF